MFCVDCSRMFCEDWSGMLSGGCSTGCGVVEDMFFSSVMQGTAEGDLGEVYRCHEEDNLKAEALI